MNFQAQYAKGSTFLPSLFYANSRRLTLIAIRYHFVMTTWLIACTSLARTIRK